MSIVNDLIQRAFGLTTEAKGVLLGLDASGRTTALYRWSLGEIVTTIPTIGFNVETIKVGSTNLKLFDVGGCDKIRPLWRHYFVDMKVVFFFWPVDDPERGDEIETHLKELVDEDTLANVPFCILASKSDLDPSGEHYKSIEKKVRNILSQNKNRLFVVMPFHTNLKDYTAPLQWAKTIIKLNPETKPIEMKDDRFKKEKDEGAKLAQWLIDCENDEPDDVFLSKLESGEATSWDHRVHLRLAWLYLTKFGRQVGKDKIFSSIENVIKNSEVARKTTFHITMTYFWMQMVHYAMVTTRNPDSSFKMFLVLNPQLSNGGLFLQYYKKETMLNNERARREFVLPDIKPLPDVIPRK